MSQEREEAVFYRGCYKIKVAHGIKTILQDFIRTSNRSVHRLGPCAGISGWCELYLPRAPPYSSRYSQGSPGAGKALGARIPSQGAKGRTLGGRKRRMETEYGHMVNWGSKCKWQSQNWVIRMGALVFIRGHF